MAYENFINENIAPYAATKIGVYDSEGNKVGVIPLGNFKPEYGDRLYRFGVLSDVHNQSDQSAESTADLQRALSIFNEKESVIMTCICGDISQNGTASEFEIYKNNVDTKSPNTPVYTTVGNHDATSSGLNLDNWNTYTGNHGRSFEVTQGNDHFLFFGMNRWSLGSGGTPYIEEDMAWLEEKLETYRNERCFIFTHLFFPDRAGNLNGIYPSGNWLGGAQLTRIQGLCDHYKNTIWFSGHSHWKWYLQKYQDRANIYRNNCGWCVHIPSCASPIDSNGSSRVSMPLESEGAIVDVYENYIDIRGMDLKNEKYLPIAQYRLDTTLVEIPAKDTPGEGQIALTWNYNTKIDKTSGDISEDISYCASDFIEVNEGDELTLRTSANNSVNYSGRVCYYDESQNFLSCDSAETIRTTDSIFINNFVIGSGVKYIRLRCYAGVLAYQQAFTNSLTLNILNEANSYSVTNNITNCATSNPSTFVLKNSSYTAILTPNIGYTLDTVTVTMGGVDITSTVYESTTKTISISNVTGNIVITATCTETAHSTIYELSEPTTFNGTSDYIDTRIQLFNSSNVNMDWTMLLDFTSNTTEGNKVILHCMEERDPYPGIVIDLSSSGSFRAVLPNNNSVYTADSDTTRHKFIITKSGNTLTLYNESMEQIGVSTPDNITIINQTLLLGAYQTSDGAKGRFFTGTVHKFKLVSGVMSRENCLAWINLE